jgi:predicted GTPase
MARRVLIMGAAGRDFHNFNVAYRDDPGSEVVAFTATQIPFIDDRRYPPELAGERYPDGIQIHPEPQLDHLIRDLEVEDVVFSYSDVSHEYVMHMASRSWPPGRTSAAGPNDTMLDATAPVGRLRRPHGSGRARPLQGGRHAAGATARPRWSSATPCRTGNWSQRAAVRDPGGPGRGERHDRGARGVRAPPATRHRRHAGVDYGAILEQAQQECDVLLWTAATTTSVLPADGALTVVDPLRPGQ